MSDIMERYASVVTYSASGSAVVFGLQISDLAALIGAGVAVLTFFVNWHYKRKAMKCRRHPGCPGLPPV